MARLSVRQLEKRLSEGIWKVTFRSVITKKMVTMICTRDFNWLSSDGISEEMSWRPPKGHFNYNPAIKVWCIERKREGSNYEYIYDWRSFYASSLKSIEFFAPTTFDDEDE